MIDEKNKIYSKYLDKNSSKSIYKTTNSFQLYNKIKGKTSNPNNKLVIHDELDPFDANIYENYEDEFNPVIINSNNDVITNLTEEEKKITKLNPIKWQEINEENVEDHEDEVRAFQQAKDNYDKVDTDSEDEMLGNKRKRHDTDDEGSAVKDRHDTEDELNELLPQEDEDGDLIIKDDPITDKAQNTKTGLFTLKEYQTNKTVQKNVFEELAKKPVETIYRDKEGRKIKPGESKKDKEKKLKELNEKQLQKWIKGFKQAEDHQRKKEENREKKNEPLARYEIDKSFEHELKQKERFGDPLKDLINFKNVRNRGDEDNVSQTSEGNLKNDLLPKKNVKKRAVKLVCKFKAPPNRYGIEPGYMWDGVDRANGFEQKMLATRNVRAAEKSEHYKLRTEEM